MLSPRFRTRNASSYHDAGLPNIEGSVRGGTFTANFESATGAFSVYSTITSQGGNSYGSSKWNFDFNASRLSTIYGASTTVQPSYTVRKIIKY